MKIKPLLEKLTDKWPAKATCIVAACVFYMFNQYNSLEQKSIPVKLNVIQDGEMICTSHLPSSISVTIRTSAENLTQVSAEGIVATLDLSYYESEGKKDVPIHVDLPTRLLSLEPLEASYYPERLSLKLERHISRPIKLVARPVGEMPYGYTVKKIICEPQYVRVTGPRSIIESINAIETEPIVVDERDSTFKETKKLVNLDRLIKIEEFESVSVTVEIDYLQGLKTFTNFPIWLENLNEKFEVNQEFFADFTVAGAQLSLDDYEPMSDAVSVDLGAITEEGEYEIPVTVLIPMDFHLENISVETLLVKVQKKLPLILDENDENVRNSIR